MQLHWDFVLYMHINIVNAAAYRIAAWRHSLPTHALALRAMVKYCAHRLPSGVLHWGQANAAACCS
jgi:hypothetical protein